MNNNIDELGKENNQQPILTRFLPRSCFEVKAKNPSAESGVYSIDPDGQISGSQPIQVYCDMTTRNNSLFITYIPNLKTIYYLHT